MMLVIASVAASLDRAQLRELLLLVRRIRELLYGEGFTIIGARGRLDEEANGGQTQVMRRRGSQVVQVAPAKAATDDINLEALRTDLIDIANLLDAG